MESPSKFYERGLEIMSTLQKEKYNIFILTNSLYILLLNIILGNTYLEGGGYKHFDIYNCAITMFEENNNGNFILNTQYTDAIDVLNYIKNKSQSIS